MQKFRIALPTKTHAGLDDIVSEVFGKAKTFTIVDVEDKHVNTVTVIDNPAASYPHGAGPIAIKTLVDLKVEIVIASEFGLGASTLLEHHNVKTIVVQPNNKVVDTLKAVLQEGGKVLIDSNVT